MKKLKLINTIAYSSRNFQKLQSLLWIVCLSFLTISQANSQCQSKSGFIEGSVFFDANMDGLNNDQEYLSNVMVKAYDVEGSLVGQVLSEANGSYSMSGFKDAQDYRLEFAFASNMISTILSSDNGGQVQFVSSPTCNANLGLFDPSIACDEEPQLVLTCFVQGVPGINDELETIIQIKHDFSVSSPVSKIATKSETGSVWGVAWDASRNRLYSSAFVKQNAMLTPYGAGAIFVSNMSGNISTKKWITMSDLGIDVGTPEINFNSCDYGSLVGRIGLGAIAIDDKEQYLYAVDLKNKSLIKIDIENPNPTTTEIFAIPNPGCQGGDHVPFALNMHEGKLYVGTTCTAEDSKKESQSTANVFEFNLENKGFNLIFQTNYIKGYWHDTPSDDYSTMHWLTDLGFTDEGNMLLSLTDRVGHRYCNYTTNRLDFQNPDLLVAWNNNGVWTLESNGKAGDLTGSGVGNNQGPDGGEFFGLEYWIPGPNYHPETALGSIFLLPGSGQVVAAVYDPIYNSYSGGLHRYVTANGKKADAKQLYTQAANSQFGKATGFGEITQMCPKPVSEVGNYVWIDANNNGVQDAGENASAGVVINLIDENCQIVGTTTTDSKGQYVFNSTNVDNNNDGLNEGVYTNVEYFIQIDPNQFDENINKFIIAGNQYDICGIESNSNDLNDSDISIATSTCSLLDGTAFMPFVLDQLNSVNHSFDIGLCQSPTQADVFDLALMKVLVSDELVSVGDVATFKISVYNQGTVDAADVTIVDYLVNGYEFSQDDNPDWKLRDNILKYKFDQVIHPGEEMSAYIKLKVVPSPTLDYVNIAEISGAINVTTGESGEDTDSSADDNPTNDAGGVVNGPAMDDVIDGDGSVDEDDHDPSKVMILDLALKIELKYPTHVYRAGDDVPYVVTIYNQGTEVANNIQVVDYLPAELYYLDSKNSLKWYQIANNTLAYDDPEEFLPGDVREYELVLTIKDGVESGDIMDYAEISRSMAVGNPLSKDFDSTPDMDSTNDMGGQVNTNNDNRVDDYGLEDEDDQDPVLLRLDFFDLALMKTALSPTITPGGTADFKITVINQGSMTANNIRIYDYIPAQMTLASDDWTYLNNDPNTGIAYYDLIIVGGLTAGQTHDVSISLTLDTYANASEYINVAEIASATDAAGNDKSNDDVDSTPDGDMNNDMGGVAGSDSDDEINNDGTTDEDDQDPARILLIDGDITIKNQCLDNATNHLDGQFLDEISITSFSGETWYISSYLNFYDVASPAPPVAPVAYSAGATGVTMLETVLGNGLSTYTMQGIHVDGIGYKVTFTNGLGTFETVTSTGGTYLDPVIEGPLAVCSGMSSTEYSTTQIAGATYSWSLVSGGTIVGPSNESSVVIDWGAFNGSYDLTLNITAPNRCIAPLVSTINIGSLPSTLACKGELNLAIGANCQVEITPEMILTNEISAQSAYAVVLMDPDGNIIPNATLSTDHLFMPIMAKVMDGCSGNSCWSAITLEDHIAPELVCQDITLSCQGVLDYQGPLASDNCNEETTLTLLSELVTKTDCDPDFVRILTRTYVAEDASGNISDECTITIYVERIDFTDVIPPADLMISMDTNLSCGHFVTDDKGNPSTILTGTPTLNGAPLFPNFGDACSVVSTYTDNVLQASDCAQKILRTWTMYEWSCDTNLPVTFVQTIEVLDDTAPVFACPDNITVSSNGFRCGQDVVLPAIEATDECTNDLRYDVIYPNGFLENQNGGTVFLPVGSHTVTYVVYDKCLNSSQCSINVTVQDITAPVTICKQNTVVSINQTGTAEVFASSFDYGSYDDCNLSHFAIKRMDGGSACEQADTLFDNSVSFCCNDVRQNIVVLFRAYDASGLYNECMVNVLVQDKFAPVITGPEDVTIDCSTLYDLNDLSEYGSATATDGCSFKIDESAVESIDLCRTGTITRTFIASDNNGSASTIQTITIENSNPFNPSQDIIWPIDYATNSSCTGESLLPQNLDVEYSYPRISEDACDLVAVSYSDKLFEFVNDADACFKIIRKWSVIDWCQSTPGNTVKYDFDQVIKVSNTIAPTILSSCDNVEVCSFDANCSGAYVELVASANDDCTPANLLYWTYQLDLNSDGIDVFTTSGRSNEVNASAIYPIGNHTIYWSFEDGCGNVTTCIQNFSVNSCKPPIAYCIDGISLSLQAVDVNGDGIADEEQATLNVENVDNGSYHSCGLDVNLSFSADVDNDSILFDCNDIGSQTVELWVTDSNGNTSFCSTTIQIQDNNDVNLCADPKECITFPVPTLEVLGCNPDLAPASLNSMPVVDPTCFCTDYTLTFDDVNNIDNTNNCTSVLRTWTINFECGTNNNSCQFVQTINLKNQNPPVVTCPANIQQSTFGAADCMSAVVVAMPTVNTDCSTGITITNNSVFATSNTGAASGDYPVGETVVVYTITDECGNSSTCSTSIFIDDATAPSCNIQDITVTLVNDAFTLNGEDLNNGSTDLCSNSILTYDVSPSTFDCTNVGDNLVTVTVSDANNNSCTSIATVTVLDNVAPVCNVADITIQVSTGSTVTVLGSMLNNGSSDSCGDAADISYAIAPATFDCSNVGDNVVSVVATDLSGNTTTCEATVTVMELVAPICILQDITVSIDANEMVDINVVDLDNGSFDSCGEIVSFLSNGASQVSFDCSNIGDNLVPVVVTDSSGNTTSCTATVTIEDTSTPICNAQDITVTLDVLGQVSINAADINNGSSAGCTGSVSFEVTPQTFTCDEVGENTVILTVTDNNNNTSTCTAIVTVLDEVAPVCQLQDITVTLDASGVYTIVGADMDNGSTDACGMIESFTTVPATLECADAGDNLVTVTVTDNSGNTSTCEATVTILDVSTPQCNVQDITVSIGVNGIATITADDVNNGSASTCGTTLDISLSQNSFDCTQLGDNVVTVTVTDSSNNSTTCTATVTVVDDNAPVLSCPANIVLDCNADISDLSVYGVATVDNSCTEFTISETVVSNVNSCNIGTIVRTFTSTNGTNTSQCSQIITLSGTANALQASDITFPPAEIDVTACADLSPDNLPGGNVVVDQSNLECSNITITYTDNDPTVTCTMDTIFRTFVVTDSCQIVANVPGSGLFTFVQQINITDNAPPVITGPADMTFDCPTYVSLPAIVTDCRLATVSHDSPYSDANVDGDASGFYLGGTTVVTITAVDECGLSSTYSYTVTVTEDNEAPVAECKKVFYEMDDTGMVELLPEQFVCLLNDNCSDSLDINLEIRNIVGLDTTYVPNLILTCDDLTVLTEIRIRITDESGNTTLCRAGYGLSDPNGFCNSPNAKIEGIVTTENVHFVDNVKVALQGSALDAVTTNSNGLFAFPSMETGGTYMVMPTKDINPLEGISTLDLLFIQRHILGVENLDSPYKYIAADINNSNSISSVDLLELRKLILGVNETFLNNTSWKMVEANYEFDLTIDPLVQQYNDYLMLDPFTSDVSADFIGVKIGDVNDSWIPSANANTDVQSRTANDVILSVQHNKDSGLVLYANSDVETYGLQLELDLQQTFEISSISSDFFDISNANWNVVDQKIIMSITNDNLIKLKSGEAIFNVKFVYPIFEELIKLTSDQLSSELYDQNLSIRNIAIDQNSDLPSQFEVFQNEPNPWSEYTTVAFMLPEAQTVNLRVYDMSGKNVYQKEGQFDLGKNEIRLNQNDLNAHGMFYFELILENGTSKAIKMIILR